MFISARRAVRYVDVDDVLVMADEIDTYTAPELADGLAGRRIVTVDAAGVAFTDEPGLRVRLGVHQARRDATCFLTRLGPTTSVQSLHEVSVLAGHLAVHG